MLTHHIGILQVQQTIGPEIQAVDAELVSHRIQRRARTVAFTRVYS